MKKKLSIIAAILAFVIGIGLVAYPSVSNWLNQIEQDKVKNHQQQVVGESSPSTLEQAKQAAIDYNNNLSTGKSVVVDPFDPTKANASTEDYVSVLNLAGDGVMGQLVIPSIGVDLPIYHGTDEKDLVHGVGHLEGTSVPIGGKSTHAVLAGHTGLPSATIFDRLDQMKEGDYFIIQVLGEAHAYRVIGTQVVLPEETDSLLVQPGKDLATLVTCTPYGVNTHRLLVTGERSELPDWWTAGDHALDRTKASPGFTISPLVGGTIAGTVLALAAMAAAYVVYRRRQRNRQLEVTMVYEKPAAAEKAHSKPRRRR